MSLIFASSVISARKMLSHGFSSPCGRNNLGRITSRHRSGRSSKRIYRVIDMAYKRHDFGEVISIEYDPNRTAYIALMRSTKQDHKDCYCYIVAHQGINIGDIINYESCGIESGRIAPLKDIPNGVQVYGIERRVNGGACFALSAGVGAKIVSRHDGVVSVKLPSGSIVELDWRCRATVGSASNPRHNNLKRSKAGSSRWMGIRPSVRGVAMNPVDHPHGGGEGKTSGGRHPVTPWGKMTKGMKTSSMHTRKRKVTRVI